MYCNQLNTEGIYTQVLVLVVHKFRMLPMQQMTVQLLVGTGSETQSKPELESTVSPMNVTSGDVLLCTLNLPFFLFPLQQLTLREDSDNFVLLMLEERDERLNSEYQLYQRQMNTIPPQVVDKDSVIRMTRIKRSYSV